MNIGLNGRALAYSNEKVILDDGTNVGMLYHRYADGGATFTKEDGMGYYYLSVSAKHVCTLLTVVSKKG
jgi:hypothetical protein